MTNEDNHKIVRLWVERDDMGLSLGVLIRCECGWESGPHFSSFSAQAMHVDHVEHLRKEKK